MRPGAPCAGSAPAPLLLTPFLLLLLAAVCTAVSASKYFLMFGCCTGPVGTLSTGEVFIGNICLFWGAQEGVDVVVLGGIYRFCLGRTRDPQKKKTALGCKKL